jgi:tetratricopeptide (TPR) repeat protein
MEPMSFAQAIRTERVRRGWSQARASEGICTVGHLSLLEAGKRQASPEVRTALSMRLGLCLDAATASSLEAHPAFVTADLAVRIGELDRALERVAELTAGSPARVFVEALVDEQRGRMDEAMLSLARAQIALPPGSHLWMRVAIAQCRCGRIAGDFRTASDIGERFLRERIPAEDPTQDLLAEMLATLSSAYAEVGDYTRARELTAMTDEMESADPWQRAVVAWSRCHVLYEHGEFEQARAAALEGLSNMNGVDRPLSRAKLELNVVACALRAPKLDIADAEWRLQRLIPVLRDLRAQLPLATACANYASLALRDARPEEARRWAEEALTVCGDEPSAQRASITGDIAEVMLALGDRARAHALLLQARTLLEDVGARRDAALIWSHLAALYEALGDTELALACMKAAANLVGIHSQAVALAAQTSKAPA